MPYRFRLLGTAAIAGLIAAALVGCAPQDRGDAVIEGLTSLAAEPRAGATLASMTAWEWDEVYFFPENTAVADINDRTGIDLPGGYVSGDHLVNSTLVFVADGAAVERVQTTAAPLIFDTAHTWEPYPYPGELEVVGASVQFTPDP